MKKDCKSKVCELLFQETHARWKLVSHEISWKKALCQQGGDSGESHGRKSNLTSSIPKDAPGTSSWDTLLAGSLYTQQTEEMETKEQRWACDLNTLRADTQQRWGGSAGKSHDKCKWKCSSTHAGFLWPHASPWEQAKALGSILQPLSESRKGIRGKCYACLALALLASRWQLWSKAAFTESTCPTSLRMVLLKQVMEFRLKAASSPVWQKQPR